eukprot:441586_1
MQQVISATKQSDSSTNIYSTESLLLSLNNIHDRKIITSLIDIISTLIRNANKTKYQALDLTTLLQTLNNSKPALEILSYVLLAIGFNSKTCTINNVEASNNKKNLQFLKYVYNELHYRQCQKSLVFRESFNCYDLIENFPPKYIDTTKKEIFKLIAPQINENDCGRKLIFSEYGLMSLPETIPDPKTFIFQNKLIIEPNIYQYAHNDKDKDKSIHFYVNFADNDLFGFYRGSLFAQDEIMTVEHPILCSLKEKILKSKWDNNSKLSDECSASFIILNAIKHGHFAQDNLQKIYGNNFGKDALKYFEVCKPPIYDNIICIACLSGSMSKYTKHDILGILNKAYCGFFGAKSEILYQS